MAQLGDFARARVLLRQAESCFGTQEHVARARCRVAEAEIALVCRDLAGPSVDLGEALEHLESAGDGGNAVHARLLSARLSLLLGRIAKAEERLAPLAGRSLPPVLMTQKLLLEGAMALRRLQGRQCRTLLEAACGEANRGRVPALIAEAEQALAELARPLARRWTAEGPAMLDIQAVEDLLLSPALIIDACRHRVILKSRVIDLSRRPVLFGLARHLAEAGPEGADRGRLLSQVFGARSVDESHRARLRVEIGRLRRLLRGAADIDAVEKGFVLRPVERGTPLVLMLPPADGEASALLSLLGDGEAWSSTVLALALGLSPRSVQRETDRLARLGRIRSIGRGRTQKWVLGAFPGFPSVLLLPGPLLSG